MLRAETLLADQGGDVVVAEVGADFKRHNFVRADRSNTSQLDKPGLPAARNRGSQAHARFLRGFFGFVGGQDRLSW